MACDLWVVEEVNPFSNGVVAEAIDFTVEQTTVVYIVEASCIYIPAPAVIYLTVDGIFLVTVDGEKLRVLE